jgi:type VII secretion protein EccB
VVHSPDDRLVPVANLSAARLVLAATGADAATATAVEVSDTDIAAATKTPTAAIDGAGLVTPENTVASSWALCDQTSPDGVAQGTTIIGGAAAPAPTAAEDGVLAADPDENTWLITDGRRYRVDAGDGALLAAYGLSRVVPRPASPALLDLLPEGPDLATPAVPDRGKPAPAGLPGRVGDVLVSGPAGGDAAYFVVLPGGLQRVPEVVANLLRVASGADEPRAVAGDVLAAARLRDDLAVDGWPAAAPHLHDPTTDPVLCWTWNATDQAGEVHAAPALPLPAGVTPVPLARADGAGPAVDAVAIAPGGAVRATAAAPNHGLRSGVNPDPDTDGQDSGTGRSSSGSAGSSKAGADGADSGKTGSSGAGSGKTGSSGTGADESDSDGAGSGKPGSGGTDSDSGKTGSGRADQTGTGSGQSGADETAPTEIGADGNTVLVSPNGDAYLVVDTATASALGVAQTEPAPGVLLDLLPAGKPLDLAAVTSAVGALTH